MPARDVIAESLESVKLAQLRYVRDNRPGIGRVRRGGGFQYVKPDGTAIRDSKTLLRIKRLAIPPAWMQVWICPLEIGHIQASGRDARGRKQYRYHALWREVRDESKYGKMIAFARSLPTIRRRIRRDLALAGLPRRKVLAAVVAVMQKTFIRVGNSEYAHHNDSYGLTTLQDHHARVRSGRVVFEFNGKSGKPHQIDLADRTLARIISKCQELPGEELFQYVDDHGRTRDVGSSDVNHYLRQIAGDDFTAKDFRTWAGTMLAARALKELGPCPSQKEARRNVNRAIEVVAERLGNTVAVCRKCYVHPAIVDSYLNGSLPVLPDGSGRTSLSAQESAVRAFLARTAEPRRHHARRGA